MVTADHGECFGEDGLWGHAIYHPKIMHVPLLIFTVGGCPGQSNIKPSRHLP
jgi:glucan phosphoethanolaminetransferase (alkaline phosphatase superfamily)